MDATNATQAPANPAAPAPDPWPMRAQAWEQLRGVAYNAARERIGPADALDIAQIAVLEVWRMRARVPSFFVALNLSKQISERRAIDHARRQRCERAALAFYAARARDD
jgi:DNA-directed RNA polymerase specialized sigma24 family protein